MKAAVGLLVYLSAFMCVVEGQTCCRYDCKKGDKICPSILRKVANVNWNGMELETRIEQVADEVDNIKREATVRVPSNYSASILEDRALQQMNDSMETVESEFKGKVDSIVECLSNGTYVHFTACSGPNDQMTTDMPITRTDDTSMAVEDTSDGGSSDDSVKPR